MAVTKQAFINKFQARGIDSALTDKIRTASDSPLTRGFEADLPQRNNTAHSLHVFNNILEALDPSLKSRLGITNDDYLLLGYASLLHDISKSRSPAVKKDIDRLKSLYRCCKLTSDHGVISAHYIGTKHKQGYIKLYGLKIASLRKLQNIISFHNSGIMHTHFVKEKEPDVKELFLCLVFWLADTVEGTNERVQAALMVNKRILSSKTIARLGVDRVSIKNRNVVWRIKGESRALKQALVMTNSELSKHSLLLQVFGLPSRVIARKKGKKIPKQESIIEYNHLISANLYVDVSKRDIPLVLSGKTLPELYDKVVEAFCQVSVRKGLSSKNYFGPITLEVKDVENDKANQISIRSESEKNYDILKNYTERWLSEKQGAEKDFYFGYTHGQRIYDYFYPSTIDDLEDLLDASDDTKREEEKQRELREVLKNSVGKNEGIPQFEHILEILQKGPEARRAYAVIPNLIIDNPKSNFHIQEEMAPALLAIQFMIEEKNKLSGFALLRAQELSTFFVVNYLEVKELINKFITKLKGKFPKIKPGRIVMLSAFGYFDSSSPLLDKPEICKKGTTDLQRYGRRLHDSFYRNQLITLLEEFKKDYIRIETKWCARIAGYLRGNRFIGIGEKSRITMAMTNLKGDLDRLDAEIGAGGHSITGKFRQKKTSVVDKFINTLKEVFDARS